MAQILVPTSDQAAGGWTTTPLWSKVDDDSTVNPTGDGVEITSDNNTNPDNADFKISNGSDPAVSTGHILRARWYRNQAGNHNVQGVLELWEGVPGTGTLRATLSSAAPIETAETEDTYTLSGAEADAITDYTNLYLRLQRSGGTGGSPGGRESLIADLIELEIPDAGTQHSRTPQDDVGITDAAGQALASSRSSTDPFGITDAAGQALEAARTETDAVGIVDSWTAEKSISVTITDSIGVTDTEARVVEYARTETEAIGITDDALDADLNLEAITDPVGITDSVTYQKAIARTITDPIGITDDALDADLNLEAITDPVGITDAAGQATASSRSSTDPVGITDNLIVDLQAGAITRTITDPIGVADTLNYAEDEAQSLADNVGITDSITAQLSGGEWFTPTPIGYTPTPVTYTPKT